MEVQESSKKVTLRGADVFGKVPGKREFPGYDKIVDVPIDLRIIEGIDGRLYIYI